MTAGKQRSLSRTEEPWPIWSCSASTTATTPSGSSTWPVTWPSGLLQLQDAYAYKDAKGKVRIHQAVSLTGAGAASGALWGTLIGLIFLKCRLLAWLSGRAPAPWPANWPTSASTTTPSSRSAASSRGAGRRVPARQVGHRRPGDRGHRPFNPIIQTNLSHDREEELVKALRSDGSGAGAALGRRGLLAARFLSRRLG